MHTMHLNHNPPIIPFQLVLDSLPSPLPTSCPHFVVVVKFQFNFQSPTESSECCTCIHEFSFRSATVALGNHRGHEFTMQCYEFSEDILSPHSSMNFVPYNHCMMFSEP